jgi:hypothetical protein
MTRATVICLAFVLIASIGCCVCYKDHWSYLPYEDATSLFAPFKAALEKLPFKKGSPTFNSFISFQMKSQMNSPKASSADKQVYEMLSSVEKVDGKCSPQLIGTVMSVHSAGPPANDFDKFLSDFIDRLLKKDKFKSCAKQVNSEFVSNPNEPEKAKEIGMVLRAALNLSNNSDVREFHDQLSGLKLPFSGEGSVTRMLTKAKELETNPKNIKSDSFAFLRDFWLARCRVFDDDKQLYTMLNIVGLARANDDFSPSNYDVRLMLLSEYRRLCYQWQGKHSEKGWMYRIFRGAFANYGLE